MSVVQVSHGKGQGVPSIYLNTRGSKDEGRRGDLQGSQKVPSTRAEWLLLNWQPPFVKSAGRNGRLNALLLT
jgi:hypothetical protein